jgi:hypothetical protein
MYALCGLQAGSSTPYWNSMKPGRKTLSLPIHTARSPKCWAKFSRVIGSPTKWVAVSKSTSQMPEASQKSRRYSKNDFIRGGSLRNHSFFHLSVSVNRFAIG